MGVKNSRIGGGEEGWLKMFRNVGRGAVLRGLFLLGVVSIPLHAMR